MSNFDRTTGTVRIEGLRQIRKQLRDAGDDLQDLKALNKDAATIVAHAAQNGVPILTGRLAATIRPAGTKTAGIVRAGKKAVPYANAVHWGRKMWPSQRSISKTRGRFKSDSEGSHFLSDAALATQAEWLEMYSERIDEILDTIKGQS